MVSPTISDHTLPIASSRHLSRSVTPCAKAKPPVRQALLSSAYLSSVTSVTSVTQGLLSSVYLGRKQLGFHWLGMLLVVAGVLTVGTASLFTARHPLPP